MNPKPRIVVTLPARSTAEARPQMAAAARAGADLVELRLDLWSDEHRQNLKRLFPTHVPTLGTLRSQREGGEGPNGEAERAEALARLAGLPFAFVDLELERDQVPPAPTDGRPSRWVGSRHFPDGTPVRVIDEALARRVGGLAFRKFVVPASVGRFFDEILPNLGRWVDPQTLLLTTGPSGSLGRIWARELHQPVVFAALPDSGSPDQPLPVEPSQVPVDQLQRIWSSAQSRRFAVLGHPIAHSLSPAIHAGWLASERRAATFVSVDVADERELQLLAGPLGPTRWSGWSVTSPWKAAASRLADRRSEAVTATGVANTLLFESEGVRAELTDSDAVRRRTLELVASGDWDGGDAVVLGTGGAARAAVFALAPPRRRVWVAGRAPDAVRAVADSLGAQPADAESAHSVGLVVHATTVGRAGSGPIGMDVRGWLGPGTTLLDFVYGSEDGTLRRVAESVGARYEDGRRLLVYQASEAYRIWWGEAPGDDAELAALRRVGCAA